MEILIGCDPELFVKQNNLFQSAWNLIRGDKKNPQKVRNGAVQVDGMALEFNIVPASTEDQFLYNVKDVLDQLVKMVPGYQVVAVPVAHFTEEHMKLQPPEALELGCDPDYNGWTGDQNIKPNADRPMRTASGHVHIGWRAPLPEDEILYQEFVDAAGMARQQDFYLGLGSLFYDADQERRQMYGNPGCFRVKPYGMEYRTLSNAWLRSDELTKWVHRNAVRGALAYFDNKRLDEKYGNISDIILNSDKDAALKIIKAEGLELPPNV